MGSVEEVPASQDPNPNYKTPNLCYNLFAVNKCLTAL